jgi:hypothetical protein
MYEVLTPQERSLAENPNCNDSQFWTPIMDFVLNNAEDEVLQFAEEIVGRYQISELMEHPEHCLLI